jgi:hypothetical protein
MLVLISSKSIYLIQLKNIIYQIDLTLSDTFYCINSGVKINYNIMDTTSKRNKSNSKKTGNEKMRYIAINGDDKFFLEKKLGFAPDIATNHVFFYEIDENKSVKRWGVTLKQMPKDEKNLVNTSSQHLIKCSWSYYPNEGILAAAKNSPSSLCSDLDDENSKEVTNMFIKYLGGKVSYSL